MDRRGVRMGVLRVVGGLFALCGFMILCSYSLIPIGWEGLAFVICIISSSIFGWNVDNLYRGYMIPKRWRRNG
jgi:hypothetical protein